MFGDDNIQDPPMAFLTVAGEVGVVKPKLKRFVPKPDITAYEIALVFAQLEITAPGEMVIAEEIERHFVGGYVRNPMTGKLEKEE